MKLVCNEILSESNVYQRGREYSETDFVTGFQLKFSPDESIEQRLNTIFAISVTLINFSKVSFDHLLTGA